MRRVFRSRIDHKIWINSAATSLALLCFTMCLTNPLFWVMSRPVCQSLRYAESMQVLLCTLRTRHLCFHLRNGGPPPGK